jgi:hypothetical protein
MVGDTSTFDFQLEEAGRKLFPGQWSGVFSADTIKFKPGKPYAIANLDKLGQAGSHWVALFKKGKTVHVYDSFGRMSSKILPSLGGAKDSDLDAEQREVELNCGSRSLAWLLVVKKYGIESALKI